MTFAKRKGRKVGKKELLLSFQCLALLSVDIK
jgi:hypothetical protein